MPLSKMTLPERIQCVRLFSLYEKPSQVQMAWRKKFGTNPPSKKTIVAINKKFDETGSVADLSRSGRPKSSTSSKNAALVQNAIRSNPTKTLRAIAQDLGINKTSVHRIKREAEKCGTLNQEENRKLKEQIITLNKQMERKTVAAKKIAQNAYNNGAVVHSNIMDPIEFVGVPTSANSNSMIYTPVVSETQILHLDPEAFRMLQAQCSKPDANNSVTFF